jgi:hypothetical protein
MVCPSFWEDYYMLIYTHCWELMNSARGGDFGRISFEVLHNGVITGQRRSMQSIQISSIRRYMRHSDLLTKGTLMDGTKNGCNGTGTQGF